jgi:ribosomal protein L3 glutamine methyltransferase
MVQTTVLADVLESGTKLNLEAAIRGCASAFEQHQLEFGHGTHDALSEASWLVLHALDLSPLEAPDYARELSDEDIKRINAIVRERITKRLPAAYITGKTWFAGLAFRTDERALVPRSPIAEFILHDFYELIDVDETTRVLDLCTGGGCIAIACAMQLPHATVDASDLSQDALALAQLNVQDHKLQDRVTLIHGSLFDEIQGQYDLIISNPPYVDANDIDSMADEFRHEPLMGLAAGTDGLDLVRLMLDQAASYLKTDDSLLVVEVGNSAPALESAYPDVPFVWLEFQNGGSGVFVINKYELLQHADAIKAGLTVKSG